MNFLDKNVLVLFQVPFLTVHIQGCVERRHLRELMCICPIVCQLWNFLQNFAPGHCVVLSCFIFKFQSIKTCSPQSKFDSENLQMKNPTLAQVRQSLCVLEWEQRGYLKRRKKDKSIPTKINSCSSVLNTKRSSRKFMMRERERTFLVIFYR